MVRRCALYYYHAGDRPHVPMPCCSRSLSHLPQAPGIQRILQRRAKRQSRLVRGTVRLRRRRPRESYSWTWPFADPHNYRPPYSQFTTWRLDASVYRKREKKLDRNTYELVPQGKGYVSSISDMMQSRTDSVSPFKHRDCPCCQQLGISW